jgi:hypothetical protein
MRSTTVLKIPTYECKVFIIVTEDLKKEYQKLCRKYNEQEEEGEAEAMVFSSDMSVYYVVFDKKYLSHNSIAHECYHLVREIKKDRDIKDDEAGAWLMGHVSGYIYKFLHRKKFSIKHG